MAILYIILSLGAIYVLMVVVMVVVLIFRLATGKMTREQLYANVEANRQAAKARKLEHGRKRRPSKGWAHFIGLPSPLNRWGLWN